MPRYQLAGDVWQIVQSGKQLEITSGGKTTVRKFLAPEQAAAQLDKLVAERVAAGYQLALRDPRHSQLEAAIAADPEDPASYAVYADWLESEGDPRGALISLQLAAEAKTGDPAKLAAAIARRLRDHAEYLVGPLARYPDDVLGWKLGFVHRAYLDGSTAEPDQLLELLLQHPSGRFLAELTVVRDTNVQPTIDVLTRLAPASLRTLGLRSLSPLELSALWPVVPRLRQLTVTGRKLVLGELALPQLEQLHVADFGMTIATGRMLARMPWPALRHLRLDLGHDLLTGDASIDELLALVEREDLTSLAQLGLLNTRAIGELVRELPRLAIAKQLEILDLSSNQMTDAHALELARHRDQLPRLVQLHVSRNRLTARGLEALAGLAATVHGAHQIA